MVSATTASGSGRGLQTGELVVRVCGAQRDGQWIRLKSDKCSIGSDPRCTLRLRGRGILPMHCLVVRGPAGAIVRRWSSDTRLNGRTFDEAALEPGDRLSLGPVELEVIDPGRVLAEPPANDTLPTPTTARLDAEAAKRFTAERRAARRLGRGRIQRLVAALRSARTGCDRLQAASAAEQHTLDELRQQVKRLETEHAERTAADVAAANPATEPSSLAELDAIRAELETLRAELRSERSELQEERARWQTERDAWIAAREQWNTERDEAERYLEGQAAEIERERDLLEQREQALENAAAAEGEPAGPVDLHEVLRRYGASVDEKDDVEDSPSPRSAEQTPAKAASAHSGHDNEESIDDYMARLMQRVRGDESGVEPGPRATRAPVATPREDRIAEAPATEQMVPQPNVPPQRKPVDLAPRAVAPEKESLSAMRELANLSAHSALHHHQHRMMLGATRSKLFIAVGAAVAGMVVLGIEYVWGPSAYGLYGAAACLLTAVCWGVQFFVGAGRIVFRGRQPAAVTTATRETEPNGDEAADTAQQSASD